MNANTPEPQLSERERGICQRFTEHLTSRSDGLSHAAKTFPCREDELQQIAAGSRPVSFRLALRAAELTGLSLLYLNRGEGDYHAKPRGMGWLNWDADGTCPFSEVFDSHLTEFAARAGTDRCAFRLCKALDLAKAALARGEMSAEQEAALRSAVAPWLG